MSDLDRLSAYDYPLPEDLIAHLPADRRDASRLMTLAPQTGEMAHRRFTDLPDLLHPGDLLVLNDTRVLPAKLVGIRESTGGRWEGLFLGLTSDGLWDLIAKTRGSIQSGETIAIKSDDASQVLQLELIRRTDSGGWHMKPLAPGSHLDLLAMFGEMPLPPYIDRDHALAIDRDRYQTTYSRVPGAVAAPTAGLHFTPEIFQRCEERGIKRAFVTLHVGIGTFRPVSVENLAEHQMHSEWAELPQVTVDAIRATKDRGGRIIAVGTTSVRTLESAASAGGLRPWSGETSIFIRPPYEFRVIDGLVTNFHLPKSTLLMLVSALAGRDNVLRAYETAVRERYRFFSYGDAMLIAQ
ncbi:S-adenosylmethionine:tRNA ribosyltransferase-isomerase [Planctomyces sp. SCGC AG-212-M04]|nr:S-adenosylmethionine:tRNA ribosyltransferase-isomerase [Planctomyces sp. SCGC AG-212-M04]